MITLPKIQKGMKLYVTIYVLLSVHYNIGMVRLGLVMLGSVILSTLMLNRR